MSELDDKNLAYRQILIALMYGFFKKNLNQLKAFIGPAIKKQNIDTQIASPLLYDAMRGAINLLENEELEKRSKQDDSE